jgi:integrase
LNYIVKEKHLDIGFFHHRFYIPSEDIDIFTLSSERIHELIFDKDKEKTLGIVLQKIKDVFLFGCTVVLRYSDLKALAPSNVEIINGSTYIRKLSLKTQTFTRIKLPAHALEILKKYLGLSKKHLLPQFTKEYMNKQIKKVMKHYGFTEPVVRTRTRRGIPVALKKKSGKMTEYNFCDVITTHTMRRTAITNLLSVGVPENIARQLSGHSPQSKEFYRYVTYAQTLIDKEMDVAYSKLLHQNSKTNVKHVPKIGFMTKSSIPELA